MPGIRRLVSVLALLSLGAGCATSAPPPPRADRYSPEQMRSGPSLQETGRFGVTPISSNGLRIQDARADGTPPPAPTPTAKRSRKHRAARTLELGH
jgi:hypothetical protein